MHQRRVLTICAHGGFAPLLLLLRRRQRRRCCTAAAVLRVPGLPGCCGAERAGRLCDGAGVPEQCGRAAMSVGCCTA